MPPKGTSKQIGSRIPEDLHTRARVFCLKNRRTLEEFVAEAIKEKLDREEGIAAVAPSDKAGIQSVRPFRRKGFTR